jgi:hypothetical protein
METIRPRSAKTESKEINLKRWPEKSFAEERLFQKRMLMAFLKKRRISYFTNIFNGLNNSFLALFLEYPLFLKSNQWEQ